MTDRTSDSYRCPLCVETYDDRTALRVHLEVEHRKSELVAHLVEGRDDTADSPVDGDRTVSEEERAMPSAD